MDVSRKPLNYTNFTEDQSLLVPTPVKCTAIPQTLLVEDPETKLKMQPFSRYRTWLREIIQQDMPVGGRVTRSIKYLQGKQALPGA